VLQEELPNIHVSISSEVSPTIREYPRASTTVANAYVQPLAGEYLDRLEDNLKRLGFDGPVHLMLSNGGTTSKETAAAFPIRLVESGPAAGAMAAVAIGASMGYPNLIAFDMGGTTAKATLIRGGQLTTVSTFEVARV